MTATNIAFSVSPRAITVLLDNRWRSIDASSPNYPKLYEELRKPQKDTDLIRELIDIPSFIAKVTFGRVQVGGDSVRFDGREIAGAYVNRLLALMSAGFDIEPIARYLELREQNPVFSAREELDEFFSKHDTAITPDGHLLLFKKVQDDYTSYHRSYDGAVFNNAPGQFVEIAEDKIDLDRNRECSSGLHVCVYTYLPHYFGGQGKVVICKVNPSDVRSIPRDYDLAKLRVRAYQVVGEIPEHEAATFFSGKPVYDGFDAPTDHEVTTQGEGVNTEENFTLDGDDWFIDETSTSDEDYTPYGDDLVNLELPVTFDIRCALTALDENLPGPERAGGIMGAFYWDSAHLGAGFWDTQYVELLEDGELDPKAVEILERYIELADAEDNAAKADETQPVDEKVFRTRDGRLFTATEIEALVKEHGQRGFARVTGVPRTTVQEWLKQI